MKKLLIPLLLVVFSYFSVSSLITKGYFNMHDDTQVARVYEMKNALEDGMMPVRWVENLGFGYGYPIFNFYSPLPYYIGGVINYMGADSLTATKIMFGIGILLSGFTMFAFLKKFFSPLAAAVGAIVYLYFPYHAVNVYVRGAVGEYFAYAFLPLVFLSLYGLYEVSIKSKQISLKYIALFAFSFFLVTTSHNLTAFMMMLLVIVFIAITSFFVKHKKNFLLSIGGGILLGIGLSAFYILPAVFESGYTNVASQIGGTADYRNHFVCITQYWDSMWGFGGTAPGCVDGFSFKLGKINVLLLLASFLIGLYIYFKKKKIDNIIIINTVLLLTAFFLTLPISRIIWDTIPFMQYLQYPWRFINFIALFLTFAIGYLLFQVEKFFGMKVTIACAITLMIATVLINGKLFTPQYKNLNSASYYTNSRFIQFDTSKLTSEYMPKNFDKPKNVMDLPIEVFSAPGGSFTNISKKTNEVSGDYVLEKNVPIHINIAYYPAWHAYINGEEVEVNKDSRGINIDVPKNSGRITLKYEHTPVARLGNLITICSFIGLIVVIIIFTKRNTNGK